jgi:hypothetical protein
MQARDGPVKKSHDVTFPVPQLPPTDTGISSPVKRSELMTKRPRKPPSKTAKKPPTVSGYNWKSDSSGFALRKVVYVTDPDTGIKTRKLPRIGHLSKSAFAELKRKHRGAALERAIAEWIAERDRT